MSRVSVSLKHQLDQIGDLCSTQNESPEHYRKILAKLIKVLNWQGEPVPDAILSVYLDQLPLIRQLAKVPAHRRRNDNVYQL